MSGGGRQWSEAARRALEANRIPGDGACIIRTTGPSECTPAEPCAYHERDALHCEVERLKAERADAAHEFRRFNRALADSLKRWVVALENEYRDSALLAETEKA